MKPPHWRPRRIAWLLTHASLRSAEVPVLQSLGCEVWVQKAYPDGPSFRSCSTDTRWDEGSTLPPDVLADLNAFDFYERPITPRIRDLLNEHFDLAVIDMFPLKASELLANFQGPVLARAFGMESPMSYSKVFFGDVSFSCLTQRLRAAYRRFWMGAFYPEVIPHEHEILRRRAFHLPICLPQAAWRREGTWQGGDGRVFFVCPMINEHHSCRAIYDGFKKHFGSLPHLIAGRQEVPVPDPHVMGFLSPGEYSRLYRRAQVMYYHSQEPRHLHYHPLEAMTSGMPVIYMRGGLLEKYDTGSQAGACADHAEARQKLERVLGGDQALIEAVRESQKTAVDKWRPAAAAEAWRKWLDLFAPDADGVVPAYELWHDRPPARVSADEWALPFLDPDIWMPRQYILRVIRAGCRYFAAAVVQRRLLPRGIRIAEKIRGLIQGDLSDNRKAA